MSSGLEKGQKDILEAKEKKIKELTSKVESLETDVEKLMFEKAALEKVINKSERTVPKVANITYKFSDTMCNQFYALPSFLLRAKDENYVDIDA